MILGATERVQPELRRLVGRGREALDETEPRMRAVPSRELRRDGEEELVDQVGACELAEQVRAALAQDQPAAARGDDREQRGRVDLAAVAGDEDLDLRRQRCRRARSRRLPS